jgi:hypothetical protein
MNRVTRGIMAAVLLLSMGHVQADTLAYVGETELFYGYKSHHWITDDYTNDTHHMVGLKRGNWVAGYFNNSYDRDSFFVGYYHGRQWMQVEGFAVVGAVYGYTECYGEDGTSKNVCPMLALGVTYLGVSRYFKPSVFQLGDATVIGFRSEF